jgi:hypothetical protein
MLGSSDNRGHRLHELAPARTLRGEDLLPRGREAVIAAAALVRLLDPPSLDPPALLKPVQQRVERCGVELQDALGARSNEPVEVVAVALFVFEQGEDEQLGGAADQASRPSVLGDLPQPL